MKNETLFVLGILLLGAGGYLLYKKKTEPKLVILEQPTSQPIIAVVESIKVDPVKVPIQQVSADGGLLPKFGRPEFIVGFQKSYTWN